MENVDITVYYVSLDLFYERIKQELNIKLNGEVFADFKAAGTLIERSILSGTLNRTLHEKEVLRNRFGKPFLESAKKNGIHFSKSHTKSALVMVTASFEIGVDLEVLQETFPSSLSPRVQHPNDGVVASQASEYYRLWCMKEAFVKYLGIGLSLPFNEVLTDNSDSKGLVLSWKDQQASMIELSVATDHCCFLALDEQNIGTPIHHLSEQQSMDFILEHLPKVDFDRIE